MSVSTSSKCGATCSEALAATDQMGTTIGADSVDWPLALVGLVVVLGIAAALLLISRTGQPLPHAAAVPLIALAIAAVALAAGRLEFVGQFTLPLLALWVLWLLLPRITRRARRDDRVVTAAVIGSPLLAIAANEVALGLAGARIWPTELWGPVMVGAMWVGALGAGVVAAVRRG